MPCSAIGQLKCEAKAILFNSDRYGLFKDLKMLMRSLYRYNLAFRDLTDVPLNLAKVFTRRVFG